VATVALGLALAGNASANPPNFRAAEQLCLHQGGAFDPEPGQGYDCFKPMGFTADEFDAAQQRCEDVYKGSFDNVGSTYFCKLN